MSSSHNDLGSLFDSPIIMYGSPIIMYQISDDNFLVEDTPPMVPLLAEFDEIDLFCNARPKDESPLDYFGNGPWSFDK